MDRGAGMVEDSGQLYTIEGVAASILILITTYIVLSSTTVLTPGDTHIADLQLTQLGNDALAIMDIPHLDTTGAEVNLSRYIENYQEDDFRKSLDYYLNTLPGDTKDRVNFTAEVFYRTDSGVIDSYPFSPVPYYRENAVKVTRWVYLSKIPSNNPDDMTVIKPRVVLLEVLLWR